MSDVRGLKGASVRRSRYGYDRGLGGRFAVGPTPEPTTITFALPKINGASEGCQHPRGAISLVFTRMYVFGELNGVLSEGNVLFSN
jgi:hypothetical protein